jgi:hypothetical protein
MNSGARCADRGVLLVLNRGRVGLTAGRLGKEEAAEHVIRRLLLRPDRAWREAEQTLANRANQQRREPQVASQNCCKCRWGAVKTTA